MRCRGFVLLLLCLASACMPHSPREATGFFEFTVTIDDNGVVRSGSSVWRLVLRRRFLSLGGPPGSGFEAESTPIQLHDGSWLFFLPMDEVGDWGSVWLSRSFPNLGRQDINRPEDPVDNLSKLAKDLGASSNYECNISGVPHVDLPSSSYTCPIVLRSSDPSDPHSFEVVDFHNAHGDISGLRLKSLSFTVIKSGPTNNLYGLLPWLKSLDATSQRENTFIPLGKLAPQELQAIRYPPTRRMY
jgi:hypothetical protein